MADYVSQVRQTFLDGNLGTNSSDTKFNKRIFVIGPATKGPVSVPVPIGDLGNIESTFGDYGSSPLSLKLREAWLATTDADGARLIYGVRIGGGQYAYLEIDEATLSNEVYAQPSADSYSMKLTGRYPGTLPATVRSDIVNGKTSVVIYNPDSGVESVISYDATDLDNDAVTVHTVSELVDAINNDPNLNSVILAEYPTKRAYYEMYVSQTGTYSPGYSVVNGFPVITLTDRTTNTGATTIFGTMDLYTDQTAVNPVQAENLLQDVTSIYELSTIEGQLIEGAGYREFKLTKTPVLYPGTSVKIVDLDGDYPATMTSEFKQSLRQALVGTVSDTGTLTYTMPLYLAPDVSDTGVQAEWEAAQTAGDYDGNLPDTGVGGSGWDPDWDDVADSTSGDTDTDRIVVYFKHQNSITPIPRANYDIAWDYDATDGPEMTITIDSSYMEDYINVGDYILVDVDTVKGRLYPVTTYNAISLSTKFYQYFLTGNKLTFGAALPSSIRISYSYVRDYTIGENVILSDSALGEFTFTDPYYTLGSRGDSEVIRPTGGTGLRLEVNHPLVVRGLSTTYPQAENMDAGTVDPTDRLIHRDNDNGSLFDMPSFTGITRIGLNYTFEPEWPNITTVSQVLRGGTTGINISNNDKYTELEATLAALEQYQPDVVVLANLYLDDTKTSSNVVTGLQETVNAEFHILLNDYVQNQSTESRPCIGLISVRQPIGYNQEYFNNWIERCTVISNNDYTRAANVMYSFKDEAPKFFGVVAMPLVKTLNGVSYITSGEATVAAMYSALPANQALNHKAIANIIGVPYNMTRSQADILAKNNYITFMYSAPYGYVVADDPTVLGLASDYNTLSVVSSMQDVTAGVRDVLVPFLGMKYSDPIKNAMQSAVNRVILEKKQEGSIIDAKGTIYASAQMQRLGSVSCKLVIRPAFGIKTITIEVKAALIL